LARALLTVLGAVGGSGVIGGLGVVMVGEAVMPGVTWLISAVAVGGTRVPCGAVPVTTSTGVDVAVEVHVAVGDGVDRAAGRIGVGVTVGVEEAGGVLVAVGGMVLVAVDADKHHRRADLHAQRNRHLHGRQRDLPGAELDLSWTYTTMLNIAVLARPPLVIR
jgi:hypothetical protein